MTYLKAGVSLYLASNDTAKKELVSWLVAITIAAASVVPKAMSLSRRVQILLILAMEIAGHSRKLKRVCIAELGMEDWRTQVGGMADEGW